jgi:DNA-binding XRE family transcriptional regulator
MTLKTPTHFGRTLRKLRVKAGLSCAELAIAIDMHRTHVYALENGQYGPTWATVCAIAKALGVSTEAFR